MARLKEYFPHYYTLDNKMNVKIKKVNDELLPKELELQNSVKADNTRLIDDIQRLKDDRQAIMDEFFQVKEEFVNAARGEKSNKIGGKHFRKEKLRGLDFESKEARGMETDPIKAGLQGITALANDLENALMFDKWSKSTYQEGPYKGQPVASSARLGEGWARLPEGKQFGALAGKYVSPEMHYYLNRAQLKIPHEAYIKALSAWKLSATVWNLPTHFRNMTSNMIFAGMSGMNPAFSSSARKAFSGAGRDAWKMSGHEVDNAIRDGLFRGNATSDIQMRRNVWNESGGDVGFKDEVQYAMAWTDKIRRMSGKVGKGFKVTNDFLKKTYQTEENGFKLAKYRQVKILHSEFSRTKNLTREMISALDGKENALKILNASADDVGLMAAHEANKWFFDYSDISRVTEYARTYHQPFIVFQAKALPRIGSWIGENPGKAFFYRKIYESLNLYTEYMDGVNPSPEEARARHLERMALPSYMRNTAVRLPNRGPQTFEGIEGKQPSTSWVDLQHNTPAGSILQSDDYGTGSRFLPVELNMLNPNNPFINAGAALLGGHSARRGKSGLGLGDSIKEAGMALAPPIMRHGAKIWTSLVNEEAWHDRRGGSVLTASDLAAQTLGGYNRITVPANSISSITFRIKKKQKELISKYRKEFSKPSNQDDESRNSLMADFEIERDKIMGDYQFMLSEAGRKSSTQAKVFPKHMAK